MEAIPAVVGGFPTRVEYLRFADQTVRILVVDQLERIIDREALLRDADAAEPPYWAHLWTASRALAAVAAAQQDWAGKRVVDIGCGLGLPAVIAALRGGIVTAVDTAPAALAMTQANAALNDCAISVVQADLCRPAFGTAFDVALAADVTYDPTLQQALAAFLAANLTRDGTAWCAESVRTHDPAFRRACEGCGLRVAETEVAVTDEERPIHVRLSEIHHA